MYISEKIFEKNRKKKLNLFCKELMPTTKTQILDFGFNAIEYSKVDNYLEKHYIYPNNITAIIIEESQKFSKKYPQVKALKYDGIIIPFVNRQFDVVWSNAVLEHVGDYVKQLAFIKELNRVGKTIFMTTPNKYFSIEIHTRIPLLHLLSRSIFNKLLILFKKNGQV